MSTLLDYLVLGIATSVGYLVRELLHRIEVSTEKQVVDILLTLLEREGTLQQGEFVTLRTGSRTLLWRQAKQDSSVFVQPNHHTKDKEVDIDGNS